MKWVCRSSDVGDGADVGEQLLARADVPAVLALVDRNDDRRVVGREPGDVLTAVASTFVAVTMLR